MAIFGFQALEAFKESSTLVRMSSSSHDTRREAWYKQVKAIISSAGAILGFGCGAENSRLHRVVTHGGSSLIPLQLPQGLLQPSKQPRGDIARLWFQPRISVLNPQTHSMGIMPAVTWCIYECARARSLPGFLIALTIILSYAWIQTGDNLHLRVLKSCPRSSELLWFLFKKSCKSRGFAENNLGTHISIKLGNCG